MVSKKLLQFLGSGTDFADLGNEEFVIKNEIYGKEIGKAIHNGDMLNFSCELSNNLENMDLYKACVVSNFIGFVCEKTGDTCAGKNLIVLLVKACRLVEKFFSYFTKEDGEVDMPENANFEEIFKENRECVCAYYGFNTLCVSAMAFLARDNECREYLRTFDIAETLSFLTEETPVTEYMKSVYYVNRIYVTCSRLPLLVLDTEKRQGFIAEANDLDNCFHMIFLLEEELYKNYGRECSMQNYQSDEDLSAAAHGEYPKCGNQSYTTFFTEFNYGVYIWEQQNKHKDDVNFNDKLSFLIWGEMSPIHIPKLGEYHVVMLQRGGPSRSFSAGFLFVGHTALKPYVKIERSLSKQEYDEWERKLDSLQEE